MREQIFINNYLMTVTENDEDLRETQDYYSNNPHVFDSSDKQTAQPHAGLRQAIRQVLLRNAGVSIRGDLPHSVRLVNERLIEGADIADIKDLF